MNEQNIVKRLIEFSKEAPKEILERDAKGTVKDPNKYSLEYVFGVILDQGIAYEKAWAAPFILRERLGHLDINKIAKMNEKDLEKVMFQKPALHRYRYMAERLISACNLIIKKYDGNAKGIWSGKELSAKEIESRFREFKQIGQKKASMAVNILVRDFNIPVKSKKEIDVSNDIHVRRVFLRAGLMKDDKEMALVEAARKLNPEYPGALDFPSWVIGIKWCRPTNPKCIECPLTKFCPKILNVEVPK